MKINCIHCGHSFPLSDAYDDFEGPVKCPTCRGMLEIKAQDATLKMVRPFSFAQLAAPTATGTFVIGGTPNQQLQMQQLQQQAQSNPQARGGNISSPQSVQDGPTQTPPAASPGTQQFSSYPDPQVIGTVDGAQSGGTSPRVAA